VLSRTSFIVILNPHVLSSAQSSQRRYAVWLTQGKRASGPSILRTTAPSVTPSGALARKYPPPLPFRLSRNPSFFSSRRMASRNFCGIRSLSAISAMSTGPRSFARDKYCSALSAYRVFLESINQVFLWDIGRYAFPARQGKFQKNLGGGKCGAFCRF